MSLLLFSQKSSFLSQLLFPLSCSQCHRFYSDVSSIPYFLSSGGGPHTHSYSVRPGVTGTQSWSLSHFAQRGYPYGYALMHTCMPSIPLANLGGQAYNFSSCSGNIPDCKEIFNFYFSLTHFTFLLCCHSDVLINLVLPRMCQSLGSTGLSSSICLCPMRTSVDGFDLCTLCQAHMQALAS